jgi:hypothetical protein
LAGVTPPPTPDLATTEHAGGVHAGIQTAAAIIAPRNRLGAVPRQRLAPYIEGVIEAVAPLAHIRGTAGFIEPGLELNMDLATARGRHFDVLAARGIPSAISVEGANPQPATSIAEAEVNRGRPPAV